jgi:hypothetical protein
MADSDQTAEPARESAGDRRTREPTPNEAEGVTGGADAVEKTTYVTGKGTDPSAQAPATAPAARVSPGSGRGTTWMILAFLAIAAVLVYLLGFGR